MPLSDFPETAGQPGYDDTWRAGRLCKIHYKRGYLWITEKRDGKF